MLAAASAGRSFRARSNEPRLGNAWRHLCPPAGPGGTAPPDALTATTVSARHSVRTWAGFMPTSTVWLSCACASVPDCRVLAMRAISSRGSVNAIWSSWFLSDWRRRDFTSRSGTGSPETRVPGGATAPRMSWVIDRTTTRKSTRRKSWPAIARNRSTTSPCSFTVAFSPPRTSMEIQTTSIRLRFSISTG